MKKSIIIILLFVNFSAHAKWDTIESADINTEFHNSYTTVNENGMSEETVEHKFKI